DYPFVLPAFSGLGAPAVDSPKGVCQRGVAHHSDDYREAECAGISFAEGGQVPPPKKVPQTDAIFANVSNVHGSARRDAAVLRMSLDAKATVILGPFARGGRNRAGIQAVDHDFTPKGKLTPFGLFLPETKDLSLWLTASKISSDFIVDRL